jgi:hypothetical protein
MGSPTDIRQARVRRRLHYRKGLKMSARLVLAHVGELTHIECAKEER